MQHPLQTKKGVVIYKLVVAFELAQFFFQEEISLWRLESFCWKRISPLQSVISVFQSAAFLFSSKIEYLT